MFIESIGLLNFNLPSFCWECLIGWMPPTIWYRDGFLLKSCTDPKYGLG